MNNHTRTMPAQPNATRNGTRRISLLGRAIREQDLRLEKEALASWEGEGGSVTAREAVHQPARDLCD